MRDHAGGGLSSAMEVAATLEAVAQILDEMGVASHSATSVLVERSSADHDAVLGSSEEFGGFIQRFSIRMGCMPYALRDIAGLTVGEFCELYVLESYPETPETPLADDRYTLDRAASEERAVFAPQRFPICFVLGCGRSGTTLFRSMLNMHDAFWAPGELHLALFDTMADRATGAGPFLRHALVPEAGSRFGETPAVFSDRLARWEREGLPTTEMYRHLHEADPQTLIVDKTPTYSTWPEDLEWIMAHFPNARFLHIVRNPHDVIRSFVRMQLYKNALDKFEPGVNPYHVAETAWFRHNRNIAEALEGVAAERSLVVRFEDLVADPKTTLSGVCDLLGVSYEPSMENPYASSRQVALGAGDPRVNLLTEVEQREPSGPFYRLGEKCRALADLYRY